MIRNSFLWLLLFFISTSVFTQNGTVTGQLTEEQNGQQMGLPFANVFLEGTTIGGTTDFDGNFSFVAPTGNYVVVASFMGYETFKQNIVLAVDEVVTVTVEMKPEGVAIEGVEVIAKVDRETEVAQLLEQKKASVIKESIGARQLATMGVSDASGAAAKISGVNKTEGSGDVYIRGLGDRYLLTTMNGLPIPSDNLEKKNINLDLFSTDVIRSVGILKTYSAETYADQTSGLIDISSKTVSQEVAIGLSTGATTNILNGAFGTFRASQNMNDMVLGFYNQPYSIEDAITQQSWNTVNRNLPLNYGFSILAGKTFNVAGRNLSVFATLSHSGESDYYEGTYKKFRSNYINESFNDVEEYKTQINTTGLLNLEYKLNSNSSLNFNHLSILKTDDELYEAGRDGNGYYFEKTNSEEKDSSIFLRDQNVKLTKLFINQLIGMHNFGTRNTLRWATAYNVVIADEPDRIMNMVTMPEGDPIEFIWVGGFDQRKATQNIKDNEYAAYLKDEFRMIDEESKLLKFDLGTNFRYKTRTLESSMYGVEARGITVTSIDNLDEVLNNENLYKDKTLDINYKYDLYNASLLVYSGYFNASWRYTNFSGTIGLRYEADMLDVNWDVTSWPGRVDERKTNYNNILPALNLKYDLGEKSALRFASSKTITLPEFKEIAPFAYNSPDGRVVVGNSELMSSTNYNFDLKYEMFPRSKELLSLTGFYKVINNPINMSLTSGSSGYFKFYNTGEQANVYGVELEGKFFLIKSIETATPSLKLSFNGTRMWHNQDLLSRFQYYNKTESGLQGAANLIINASLTYSNNKENALTATVTGNYTSDKIYALGAPEDGTNSATLFNSEIMENGFVSLDVVVSKKINDRISAKLTGKNLLNPYIEQTQEIVPVSGANAYTSVVKSYRKGVKVGFSLNINLN